MDVTCKVCQGLFSTKGFHTHLRKSHKLFANEYYEKYFPRYDKYTGEKISFVDLESYFKIDFLNKKNTHEWLLKNEANGAAQISKDYLLNKLQIRCEEKELFNAPCYLEILTTQNLPYYNDYRYFFGDYVSAANLIKKPALLEDNFPNLLKYNGQKIIIDTREQQPLFFKNSAVQKLAIGDYSLSGEDYNYTFVDRKSEQDFKSTVTNGFERFVKEIERAKEFDSYIYVVIESSVKELIENNKKGAHEFNMKYVWANTRKILHLFPNNIQFVFSGSRLRSEEIIPILLINGSKLWKKDIQFAIMNGDL